MGLAIDEWRDEALKRGDKMGHGERNRDTKTFSNNLVFETFYKNATMLAMQ